MIAGKQVKKCNICGVFKPYAQFYPSRTLKTQVKRAYKCIPCDLQDVAYRAKNPNHRVKPAEGHRPHE